MSDTLISIHKRKGRQSPIINFEESFNNLERVDQIEFLISIEKEVVAKRKNITDKMFQYSKGKW